MRRAACSCLLALSLGCVRATVAAPPSEQSDEVASAEATRPVERETTEPVAASTVPPEPSPEAAPEPAGTGGHVVQPSDPAPPPPGTVPKVRVSAPTVGDTDKDVIRRIVRMHIQEIRDCYNQGLASDPTLAGRILIEFTIGPDGKVEKSTATDVSGFADPQVPKCIADAIATWTFPAPRGGGQVTVSYPFNLVPG